MAEDQIPPEVRKIDPEDGARLHPGIRHIEVNFTEAMNRSSLENALHIDPHVDYTLHFWTLDNTTFFYDMMLDPGDYEITLSGSVKDINGTEMGSPYSWSYTVKEQGGGTTTTYSFSLFWPSTSGVVIILILWYVYERSRMSRLSPEQRKRLKAMQPKTFDKYTILLIVLFAVLMVFVALYVTYKSFEMFIVIVAFVPILGILGLMGLVQGISSRSKLREHVEIEALGYPPIGPELTRKSEMIYLGQTVLTVTIAITALIALFTLMPFAYGEGDPYLVVFFAVLLTLLIGLYVYVSRLGGSADE